jgi:ribonuclease HI
LFLNCSGGTPDAPAATSSSGSRQHGWESATNCPSVVVPTTTMSLSYRLNLQAIRRALSFTREEGFDKIMLASDCLSVVQRINNTAQDRSLLGVVIQDIKMEATLFTSCSFLHVPRKLNESAHVLARFCLIFCCFVMMLFNQ